MHRRALLVLPTFALLPGALRLQPPQPGQDWRETVSEIRFVRFIAPRESDTLSHALGVPVRHLPMGFARLVDTVNRGQAECGHSMISVEVQMLQHRLGDRLVWGRYGSFVLRSLPRPMRNDILDLLGAELDA